MTILSDFTAIAAVLVLSALVVLVIRRYLPIRTTPWFLLIPVFFSLALPTLLVVLVPIDLASISVNGEPSGDAVRLSESVLYVLWRIVYWLIFSLTWILLPLLGEFLDSGYPTLQDKLKDSLRRNLRYQLIVLGCGLAFAVYLFFQIRFQLALFKSLVIALAYFWSLFQAIFLLGHGLVAVPRALLRSSTVTRRLRMLEERAPAIFKNLHEASEKTASLESQCANVYRHLPASSPAKLQLDELGINSSSASIGAGLNSSRNTNTNLDHVAGMTRQLLRSRHRQLRFEVEKFGLLNEYRQLMPSSESRRTETSRPASRESIMSSTMRRFSSVLPALRPIAFYTAALLWSVAGLVLLASELIKCFQPNWSPIAWMILPPSANEQGVSFSGQVLCAMWLLFMCSTTLFSLNEVKVWGNRALVPRHTYLESGCWYSSQVARLTVPLCFNFVTLLPQEQHKQIVFYRFLGTLIDLTPLGRNFDRFFPLFILIPMMLTLFGLYKRIPQLLSFDIVDDGDLNLNGGHSALSQEGYDLIHQHILDDMDSLPVTEPQTYLPVRSSENTVPASSSTYRDHIERTQNVSVVDESETDDLDTFSHRLQNTLGSVETPAWMKKIQPISESFGTRVKETSDSVVQSALSFFKRKANNGQISLE